jgi:hypothetical protein
VLSVVSAGLLCAGDVIGIEVGRGWACPRFGAVLDVKDGVGFEVNVDGGSGAILVVGLLLFDGSPIGFGDGAPLEVIIVDGAGCEDGGTGFEGPSSAMFAALGFVNGG